jgi:HEAT repeat protein
MDFLIFVLFALGTGGIALYKRLDARDRAADRAAAWWRTARVCGLTDLKKSQSLPHWVEAWSGTHRVCFESYERGKNERGTRLIVGGLRHNELTLRRETVGTSLEKKLLGGREIEVGEDAFDDTLYVQGSSALARALFDVETRVAVRRLFRDVDASVALQEGKLVVDIPERAFGDGLERLPYLLDAVLGVARRLVLPEDIATRLARNARGDPIAAVRLQNLLALVGEYPEHAATRDALHAACADESDEIRLRGAMALGGEGHDVLLEIASREGADDSYACRAIAALGKNLPVERAKALLDQALTNRNVPKACACIEALGRNGGAESVDTLAHVMLAGGAISASAAARALGATGQASAEHHLLEALKLDSPDLREAAAEALGRVGSVKAVLPLQAAGEGHGGTRDLRRAARQAIAEIQSRLTGASPGQLSIATGEAGQLSLAESEAGQLSVAQAEEN